MADMKKFKTSMGDGFLVYMTEEDIRKDIEAGVADAVKRGKINPLTQEEMNHIYDIVVMPGKVVGVEPGSEVVSTNDSGSYKISSKCMISIRRDEQAAIAERVWGCDSIDIGNPDYNYKTVKGIADREASTMRMALQKTTMPLFYGAMTNLGFYTKPDGPVENWSMLLPEGRIEEAMEAQEQAVEHAVRDIDFVAEQIYKAGGDGINLDTTGAAGDADFLAALKATEVIKEKYPELAVEIGMAGEFVLGMHGKLEYDGKRLAGMYVHDQVKAAEKAGASIFGAVVNTNCNKSFPWNIGRVCTFIKACTDVAEIPVHANVGMGVCGVPMNEILHTDIVSKVDKILIEICKIDGL